MDNIAKALVIAIQYLGSERNDKNYTEDDDLNIVEDAVAIISRASAEEKAALIKAAKELGLNDWANEIGIE